MLVFSLLVFVVLTNAQAKKACELVDVAAINAILGSSLAYDANSAINKTGKFECMYMDPKTPGKYISVGLLESKIAYGYDMLKTDFDNNQKAIAQGGKATGKFTKFFAYARGGANAFYMTGPKDDFSPEAFVFKFRKGDYLLTFSTNDLAAAGVVAKIDALYTLFSSKL